MSKIKKSAHYVRHSNALPVKVTRRVSRRLREVDTLIRPSEMRFLPHLTQGELQDFSVSHRQNLPIYPNKNLQESKIYSKDAINLNFDSFKDVQICMKRQNRRRVIFALSKHGRGFSKPKWKASSFIRCS